MDKNFILQWEENKEELKSVLANRKVPDEYIELVKLVFKHAIKNIDGGKYRNEFDCDRIVEIDNGDYQGTLIFIIPEKTYQPSASEHVYTSVGYGSCCGCDTLQAIDCCSGDIPNEEQLKDLMLLCLHLVQNTKQMSGEY